MSEGTQQAGPVAERRPRRWRLWATLIVCLALASWFVHFAYLRITRRPTPRPKYWAATLNAIDPLPDGALAAMEAYSRLDDCPWALVPSCRTFRNRTVDTVMWGRWDGTRSDVATITEVFTSNPYRKSDRGVRQAIRSGWRGPLGRSPFAWSSAHDYCQNWAHWLTAHSRWAREHSGDIDGAVEDWLAVLRLSRQLRRGGLGYDWFRAARWVSSVAAEMMYCASESAPAIDTHALMLRIDSIEAPGATPRALLEEARLSTHCYLESVYVRQGPGWLSVCEFVSQQYGGMGPRPSRIWNMASPLFHDLASARAAVDRYFAAAEALSDIRVCGRHRAERRRDRSDDGLTVLDGIPGCGSWLLAGSLWRHYWARCELDAGVTMLALREYHRLYESYPESLEELVPDFLPRLPIDYADRQPLRYARTDEGYLLYSIGEDGRDDGGAGQPGTWTRWYQQSNPDAVFSGARRPELEE